MHLLQGGAWQEKKIKYLVEIPYTAGAITAVQTRGDSSLDGDDVGKDRDK